MSLLPSENSSMICPNSAVVSLTDFSKALFDPDLEAPSGLGKLGKAAPKRFSVYRNNVIVSLIEAMKQTFPSLLAIMGEANFTMVSRNYIAKNPPSSPIMQHYGESFPDFLASFKPLQKSPFLADVAQLERSWVNAHHARNAVALKASDLQALAPEDAMDLHLAPLPATRLMHSAFPIHALFNARYQWPSKAIDLAHGQTVLITRPDFEVLLFVLTTQQDFFLRQILEGKNLGEAVEISADKFPDGSFDPTQAITLLIQSGAFGLPAR